ncbi:hypothetical protein L1785_13870 [Antribacter sp. KLBMP9083]|uniref:Uncharacterized protein n=1 Tax=Antribacter soli TaxID=2910976 RepID=A0AA41QFA4_9MICO|nr:hypothetical protein [Antribacter soli]MCF4122066.1 hypothetical protein [Antribacter soli]
MSGMAPVAIGYAAGGSPTDLYQQCQVIEEYARAEGIALAQIVTDDHDALTLHQVAESARHHGARLVLVPATAQLAEARRGIAEVLAPDGATCVVIGQPVDKPAPTTEP